MQVKIHHATEFGERFIPFKPGNQLKTVWEGTSEDLGVSSEDAVCDQFLNDIFRIFNIEHPANYRNRSLSVGDVIQIGKLYFAVEPVGFRHVPVWDVFKGE